MILSTQVNVLRAGTPVTGLQGITVQIDTVSLDMQNFDAGAGTFDLFNVYIDCLDPTLVIKRNDKLQDVGTSASGTYTISAKPESFPDWHWELQCLQPVGS